MDLESIGKQLAKGVKTQSDLKDVTGKLMKIILESALNNELDDHLGYEKNEKAPARRKNSRNGHSSKTVKGDHGEAEIKVPRDRDASFSPKIVPKGKTRLEGFEDNILALYARGMTTRDIQATIKELYNGAEISHNVIANVTEGVLEESSHGKIGSRFNLPIVFLDCIVVKVHQDKGYQQINLLALGINCEGKKDLLGLWISQNEGAKFWLSVLTDLQNRGT